MKLLPITITCATIALSLSACTIYDTFDEDLVAGHADTVSSSASELDSGSSSSETVESSSTSVASGCGDEVTDERDGNVYKLVKIGSQCWTARNMNFKIDETSSCYDDDDSNCEMYGRLYTWNGATDACPAGFHLPTEEEWQTLIAYAGGSSAGSSLKVEDAWDQKELKDEFGFAALPAGFNNEIKYIGLSTKAYWWTSSEVDKSSAKHTTMSNANNEVRAISTDKAQMLSVRCVKN